MPTTQKVTTVQSPAILLIIIQIVVLLLVVLAAFVAASSARRARPYRLWFHFLEALLPIGLLSGVLYFTGIRATDLFLELAGAIGAPLGLAAGLRARPFALGGRLLLKRSGIGWFLLSVSYALPTAAAWWLTKPYMSASLGVVAFMTGLVVGDAFGRQLRGAYWWTMVRRIPMAPPYVPSEGPPPKDPAAGTSADPPLEPLDSRPGWADRLTATPAADADSGDASPKGGILARLGFRRRGT
jgi:hypothetical protein